MPLTMRAWLPVFSSHRHGHQTRRTGALLPQRNVGVRITVMFFEPITPMICIVSVGWRAFYRAPTIVRTQRRWGDSAMDI